MCGVAAIFAYHDRAPKVDREELRRIRNSMSSRGPDGAGEWYSKEGRVGLAHRRLAIIDPSPAGSQPMQSEDGKFVVSFNGEIYNYRELRADLEKKGLTFRSHSDTEVLLHLYREKGEAMVHDLRGMFAFALWDAAKNTLLLARDPYGIKPLYYSDDGRSVRAASQAKALLASEKVSRLPEPAGIVGFFLMGSVPEPFTTYQEIRQVPAGSFVSINRLGPSPPQQYFSIAEVFQKAEVTNGRVLTREIIREALLDSVCHHFVSDVPVGVFLSGGIDSSSLIALAREAGIQNLQTVTLAFDEFRGKTCDEAPFADQTARIYGTRHHTRILTQPEFKKDLPRVFEAMDQPTIDGINTYFVSKAARELGLKVALSGLGGDELFGGYSSFSEIPRLVSALAVPSRIPFLGDAFRHLYSAVSGQLSAVSPKYAGLLKYGGTYPGAYFLRRGLFMPWELKSFLDPEIAREGLKRLKLLQRIRDLMQPESRTPFGRVATLEASLYMRNQLLRDADWAGMAHSLEIRTPFVDASLLKNLAPLLVCKNDSKNGFAGKKLLSDSLKIPLPEKILRRAKTGFGIPVDRWLPVDEKKGHSSPRRWAHTVYEFYKN